MNTDLTVKLIEAIKKWPVLYANSHPFFRNSSWQQEAWRQIEQEVNKNVTLLKSKWGYLKATYAQYKRLHHNIANNNNSIRPKKKKLANWVWGPYLSFLDQNPADETHDPLDETQSSSQQFAANDKNSDYSATNDTHISLPPREETAKILSSHEPSSASIKNTKKGYRGRSIDSDSKVGENEDNKDDTPIRSPHREETVNIEPNSEPSSALAKNKRFSERRRIDLYPKVHVKKENEDDTHISSPHREETVKNKPIPESNSAFVENSENSYSGRRRIMVKMERSPEPELLETSNSEDRYRRKRRIESVSEVDQREENEENRTMQNTQKSSSTTRQDNSCNSEKVEVKCDAVDLFFLGYADTFKRLSRRKQVLVKFEIAKAFLEAELDDVSDR